MDVNPGELVVLGTTAPLALKMLGPTADYVGDGLQDWAEKRVQNVQRIFDRAAKRLGDDLEQPGAVPPRVLKEILDEGSYCDDELGAEYLGGVLAASRGPVGRDDRGAALVALVGRMSTYQVRCHYLMYSYAQRLLAGSGVNLGSSKDRRTHGRVFVPYPTWLVGMDFSDGEDAGEIVAHCMAGLIRENLVGDWYARGNGDALRQAGVGEYDFGPGGIALEVSPFGMELFARAHALKGTPRDVFVSSDADFTADIPVVLSMGARRLQDLPAHEPGNP